MFLPLRFLLIPPRFLLTYFRFGTSNYFLPFPSPINPVLQGFSLTVTSPHRLSSSKTDMMSAPTFITPFSHPPRKIAPSAQLCSVRTPCTVYVHRLLPSGRHPIMCVSQHSPDPDGKRTSATTATSSSEHTKTSPSTPPPSTDGSDNSAKPPNDAANHTKLTGDGDDDDDGKGSSGDGSDDKMYVPKIDIPLVRSEVNNELQTVLGSALSQIFSVFKYIRVALFAFRSGFY